MKRKLSIFHNSFSKKGFTLIELLVVIGILGILAVAVLAAINPIEQLNKAQDTTLENDATTFVNAAVQYYTVHNTVPWDTVVNGGTGCHAGPAINNVTLGGGMGTCITKLVQANELKDSWNNIPASTLNNIFISTTAPAGNNITIYACFKPKSKAVQADQNTKYSQNGQAAGAYWCAQ